AEEDPGPHRPVPLRRERKRERAGHDQLAVREVDQAEDAEDEPDADRHQGVDAAERDRIRDRLPRDAHAKYAATSFSVSFASSGPSVRRIAPFDRTWLRSASATVRCA